MQPRLIKTLNSQSFFRQLYQWIRHFPVITAIYFCLVGLCTVFSMVFEKQINNLHLNSEITLSIQNCMQQSIYLHAKFLFFFGMTTGILYTEQSRGSCRYLMAFPVRYFIVTLLRIGSQFLHQQIPDIPAIITSTPILFCLFIASQQSINHNKAAVDILTLPLQIKTGLYPIVLIIIFQIINYRIDVLLTYIFGIVFDLINIKQIFIFFGKKIHETCCNCCFKNFIKPPVKVEYHSPTKKQMDNLVTSNSIVIEDQIDN